ncbi:MAG: hypothetical protein ACO1NM_14275 [Sphingobium phenoxybenzoativorans]|uniref:Uncharacterized protein n=1 Tax=Sphingobium phenoxybenzoativorans TaxID=1592790 RepID=A0A975Q137_9SPHN|nr:hypothetical protein [Sphingobium phenoxybenzoativorans]QUT04962.1 hypothetical protein KFK14_18355 [Sphingobium phenoxybenzoativorans]
MRDEIDGRIWADNHKAISAGFGDLLKAIMQAFCVLNHIEYAAPWRAVAGRTTK